MGKEKVIIDTNLFISALGWEGKPRILLNKVIDGELEILISQKQLAEIKRVLDYPKFGFSKEQKEKFIKIILQIAKIVETKIELEVIKEDPPDNMLLECAIETGTKIIVSGDKHLKKLKTYKGIKIMAVDELLKGST